MADRGRGPRRPALAIVTDLDGCLLDHHTYRPGPARGVLRRLARLHVPVVLSTSKTRAELGPLGPRLGGPYLSIVEDGAGLFVPSGVLGRTRLAGARRVRGGRLVPLATSYGDVRRAFAALRRETGGAAVGFGDLRARDIAALTGLPLAAARRAKRREFDEPFCFAHDAARHARALPRFARRHRLQVARGGRFWHLHGRSDKGRATRLVRELLERGHGPITLIALGDSALDAAMLRAADIPIVVPRPGGRADPALRRAVPGARVAPAPGPAGWGRAVTRALAERRVR